MPSRGTPNQSRPWTADADTGSRSGAGLASPLVVKTGAPVDLSTATTRCVTSSAGFEGRWKVITSPVATSAGSTGRVKTMPPTGRPGVMLPLRTAMADPEVTIG